MAMSLPQMSVSMPPKVKAKRFSVDKYPQLKELLESKLELGWSHRDECKSLRQGLLPQVNLLLEGTGESMTESKLSSWFKHRTYKPAASKPATAPKIIPPPQPPKPTKAAIYQSDGTDEVKIVIRDRADFDWAVAAIRERGLEGRCPLLLSPVHGELEGCEHGALANGGEAGGRGDRSTSAGFGEYGEEQPGGRRADLDRGSRWLRQHEGQLDR